jgi:cation transporter-like permease
MFGLKRRSSNWFGPGNDLEDGNVGAPEDNYGPTGALLSKLQDVQMRNIELESAVSGLKYQIEILKSNKGKVAYDDDVSGGLFDENDFKVNLIDRCGWLIGLLFCQSCSSYILSANANLINEHPAIIFFLTMLVGAGGNAGNQAAVRVIRALAVGEINIKTRTQFLIREGRMALILSVILSITGLLRCLILSSISFVETLAISVALFIIVLISVVLGATLPLFLQYFKIDPAHSSTSIQVIMDILGVIITCSICSFIFYMSSPAGQPEPK